MEQVVVAHEVSIRYGRTSARQVDRVTTEIGRGVTALVGKNGAGKSTFLKAIVGLIRPEAGELQVLGTDVAQRQLDHEHYARLGYLPQDFGYVASFTAREFVEYGAWLKKMPAATISRAAGDVLNFVGLADSANTKMRNLPGGMRRRAGIAQALVHNPDLLVLDEPTTGLDPEQRVRFRELVRGLADERAVLLSSHLVEDVRALATQVLVLHEGHLRFDGTVAQLSALGEQHPYGDSPLERGYLAVVAGE